MACRPIIVPIVVFRRAATERTTFSSRQGLCSYALLKQKSPQSGPCEVRMTPDERERMQVLCEQIAKEENRERFTNLVHELNELLENKVQRLDRPASPPK